MIKYYETITNTRGDSLPNYRVQVVDSAGATVSIYADGSGTVFTDEAGNTVNYATADPTTAKAEFYWTPATGQVLQILDLSGELVDATADFADKYVIANLPGEIAQSAVTDLVDDLAAKAATADLAASTGAASVGIVGGGNVDAALPGISAAHLATDGTDVGASFSTLFDLAVSTGRPLVLKPLGNYTLTTWTAKAPASPITIIMNGATITAPAAATNFINNPTAKVVIGDGTFDGWAQVVNESARVGDLSDSRLSFVKTRNGRGVQFNIEGPCNDYLFLYCDIDGVTAAGTAGGIRIGWNDYTSSLQWYGRITNCTVRNVSQTAATVNDAFGMLINGRVVIDNPVIENVSSVGASTSGSYGIYCKSDYSVVNNPTINNITSSAITDVIGINMKGAERGTTSSPLGYASGVFGGSIRTVGTQGSIGSGVRLASSDQRCVGTLIENGGLSCITLDEAGSDTNGYLVDDVTLIGDGTASQRGITIGNYGGVTIGRVVARKLDRLIHLQGSVAIDRVEINGPLITQDDGTSSFAAVVLAGSMSVTNLTIGRIVMEGTWTHGVYDSNTGAARTGWKIDQSGLGTATNPMTTTGTWPTDLEATGMLREFFAAPKVSHTGSTAETTLGTLTLPANCIGKNGQVEIIAYYKGTGTAGSKTVKTKFGGTVYNNIAPGATIIALQSYTALANDASASAQLGFTSAANGFTTSTGGEITSAVNTTATVDVTFTGTLASAADTIALQRYMVKVHARHF